MYWKFDSVLIEEAVFQVMFQRSNTPEYDQYRSVIDAVYELDESDENRDESFRNTNEGFFRELGFYQLIEDFLAFFPLLGENIDTTGLYKAATRKKIGAELFVQKNPEEGEARRTLVMHITPEAFLDTNWLTFKFHRELYHIADMVDPAFDYDPVLDLPENCTMAQENLLRDRYAVLWNIYIEARLRGRKKPLGLARDELPETFTKLIQRTFPALPEEEQWALINKLWTTESITHGGLLALCNSSSSEVDPRSMAKPGDPCPLCQFSTYDWVVTEDSAHCRQCAGLLDARENQLKLPATLVGLD